MNKVSILADLVTSCNVETKFKIVSKHINSEFPTLKVEKLSDTSILVSNKVKSYKISYNSFLFDRNKTINFIRKKLS